MTLASLSFGQFKRWRRPLISRPSRVYRTSPALVARRCSRPIQANHLLLGDIVPRIPVDGPDPWNHTPTLGHDLFQFWNPVGALN